MFSFSTTKGSDYDFSLVVTHDQIRSNVNGSLPKDLVEEAYRLGIPELVSHGYLSATDNSTTFSSQNSSKGNWSQVVVVHEIGHLLGMNHPGQTGWAIGDKPAENSPEDYDANPKSLMGRGMILEKNDFNDAFCSHIDEETYGKSWKAQ